MLTQLFKDEPIRSLLWFFLIFILYQFISFSVLALRYEGLSPRYQVVWAAVFLFLVTAFLSMKAGYFSEKLLNRLAVFFLVGQSTNLTFAVWQLIAYGDLPGFLTHIFLSGTMSGPELFGVYVVLTLPILFFLSVQGKSAYRWAFILLVVGSFIIPFSGKRNAFLCYLVFIGMVVSSGFIKVVWKQLAASLISILIAMALISQKTLRVTEVDNPSSHARFHLLRADLSLLSKSVWFGYGDIRGYSDRIKRENAYTIFKSIDPFAESLPVVHGGHLQIAMLAGVPALLLFICWTVLSVRSIWRPGRNRGGLTFSWVLLAVIVLFNVGYLFQSLYGGFPWVIIVLGTVVALRRAEKEFVKKPLLCG